MTPVSHPRDRPALTGLCCPVPGATPITANVFISRTDGLQASIFSSQRREGREKKSQGEGEQAERQIGTEKEREIG